MLLGFDHAVLGVTDLRRAEADLQSLGFTVTKRLDEGASETENRLICFEDGSYIEVFALRDPSRTVHPSLGVVSRNGRRLAGLFPACRRPRTRRSTSQRCRAADDRATHGWPGTDRRTALGRCCAAGRAGSGQSRTAVLHSGHWAARGPRSGWRSPKAAARHCRDRRRHSADSGSGGRGIRDFRRSSERARQSRAPMQRRRCATHSTATGSSSCEPDRDSEMASCLHRRGEGLFEVVLGRPGESGADGGALRPLEPMHGARLRCPT